MIKEARIESVYVPSTDVVAREIEGVIIIVPIVSGIGDMEDELFTLNETGKAIWQKLDGHATLKAISGMLADEFETTPAETQEDVLGLVSELLRRKMVEERSAR